jgi:hypothetical protein
MDWKTGWKEIFMKAGRRAGHKRRKMILTVIAAALVIPLYFGWSTKAPEGTSYMSPLPAWRTSDDL